MFNILLTAMLLTMPLFILEKPVSQRGLSIGLWVSLFFLGRLHASLSVLVFAIALFDYLFTGQGIPKDSSEVMIKRTYMPQFIVFLSAMVIFCALGKVYPAYGTFIQMDATVLEIANITGFFCALAGPIFFGWLSDRKGPFPAMVSLILLAASSVGITAYSVISSVWFTVGTGLLWLSISGAYVLMPILTRLYFGQWQLIRQAPGLIGMMTALWGFIYYVFETDSQQILHSSTFLTFAVYLILIAALFSFLAWKNRLVLVK